MMPSQLLVNIFVGTEACTVKLLANDHHKNTRGNCTAAEEEKLLAVGAVADMAGALGEKDVVDRGCTGAGAIGGGIGAKEV